MSSAFSITAESSTTRIASDRALLSEVPGFVTLDSCVRTVLSYCIDENYYPECPPQKYPIITDSISCLCHSAKSQLVDNLGSWSCGGNAQTSAQAFFTNTYCPMNDVGLLVPVSVQATSTNTPESTRVVTTTTTVSSTGDSSSPVYVDGSGGLAAIGIVGVGFIWLMFYFFNSASAMLKKTAVEHTSIVQNNISINVITQHESALARPGLTQATTGVKDRQAGHSPEGLRSESINSDSSASHVLHYIERPQRAQLRNSGPSDKTDPEPNTQHGTVV